MGDAAEAALEYEMAKHGFGPLHDRQRRTRRTRGARSMGTVTEVYGTSYYAMVQTPGGKYDKYQIKVGNLDDENVERMAKGMIAHRLKSGPAPDGSDFGEHYIQIERKAIDGKPSIVGPDGKTPFTGLIGNGSKVRVQFEAWKNKGTAANGHRMLGVQVLELVPYGVTKTAEFEDESATYEALPEIGALDEVEFGDEVSGVDEDSGVA